MSSYLGLSEEEQMVRDAVRAFVEKKAPVSEFRRWRDSAGDDFSSSIWKEMVQLGWADLPLAQNDNSDDDNGLSWMISGIVMEELGRQLVPTPMLSRALIGGCLNATTALQITGEPGKEELSLALAFQEGSHHEPYVVETVAISCDDGYQVSGFKSYVLGGALVDSLLVSVRTSGEVDSRQGVSLLLIDPELSGVTVKACRLMDGHTYYQYHFDRVEVPASALIGELDGGCEALDRALLHATALLSAEMLGSMSVALEKTVEHVKQRRQFGSTLASFQALQHRLVKMHVAIELTRSAVMEALRGLDENSDDLVDRVHTAKLLANDTAMLVTQEGLQLHGGLGMTDEVDIGLFLKRARVTQMLLGTSCFHLNQLALRMQL